MNKRSFLLVAAALAVSAGLCFSQGTAPRTDLHPRPSEKLVEASELLRLDPAFAWLLAFVGDSSRIDRKNREVVIGPSGSENRMTCESPLKAMTIEGDRTETWCSYTPLKTALAQTAKYALTVHSANDHSVVVAQRVSDKDIILFGDMWPTHIPMWAPRSGDLSATGVTTFGTIQERSRDLLVSIWFESKKSPQEVFEAVERRLREFGFEVATDRERRLEGKVQKVLRSKIPIAQEHLLLERAFENGVSYYAMRLLSIARD